MKGYTVDYGDEGSEFVVAETAKEAKKIAWNNSGWLRDCGEYVELKIKWCKHGDITGLKKGLYSEWLDLLKRGFFDSVYGVECPVCGEQETSCEIFNGKAMCFNCFEKKNENNS